MLYILIYFYKLLLSWRNILPILFEVLLVFAYPMALGIEKPEINVQHVL